MVCFYHAYDCTHAWLIVFSCVDGDGGQGRVRAQFVTGRNFLLHYFRTEFLMQHVRKEFLMQNF